MTTQTASTLATKIAAQIRRTESLSGQLREELACLHQLLSQAQDFAQGYGIDCDIDEDLVIALGGTDKPPEEQ